MRYSIGAVLASAVFLAACQTSVPAIGPDGKPLPQAYIIGPQDVGRVTFSMLDSINALRAAAGAQPLALNAQLTAAAATHARDMHLQNRPWHFGSDGSSPIVRVQRTGYPGKMFGENISETLENEVETLDAWMAVSDTRAVIMDPRARDVGISWYQEPAGKIWWVLVTGG